MKREKKTSGQSTSRREYSDPDYCFQPNPKANNILSRETLEELYVSVKSRDSSRVTTAATASEPCP